MKDLLLMLCVSTGISYILHGPAFLVGGLFIGTFIVATIILGKNEGE